MSSKMAVGIPRGIAAIQVEQLEEPEAHITPMPRLSPIQPSSPESERDTIMKSGDDTRAAHAERMHHERMRQEDKLFAKRKALTKRPVSVSCFCR
jgi:hypothetical protein